MNNGSWTIIHLGIGNKTGNFECVCQSVKLLKVVFLLVFYFKLALP